jgi:hypothetical protein
MGSPFFLGKVGKNREELNNQLVLRWIWYEEKLQIETRTSHVKSAYHIHIIQHVMKAFRKIVSSWAHKKEGMIPLHRKQHLFLRAQEDLTEEQAQE